jgi:hypothetical protein
MRKVRFIRSVSWGFAYGVGGYAGPFEWSARYLLCLIIVASLATMMEDIADWWWKVES